jgi:hypothetical protein
MTVFPPPIAGPVLFARFAYPPNQLGYCGPDTHRTLLEYASAEAFDPDLHRLASEFSGAWPYLQLIAHANGITDPLERRVVEAYWIGNALLDRVDLSTMGHSLRDRFEARAGVGWTSLEETIPAGAVPHHAFHVFAVYPWVGLLQDGPSEHPLTILDRCRIRWGTVTAVEPAAVTVESRPLVWTGHRLELGPLRPERAIRSLDGYALAREVEIGATVALHWDWVCTTLTPTQLSSLQTRQQHQLDMTNERLAHPGPAEVLA